MDALLASRNVTKKFGGIFAVHNVSLDIMPTDIVGLIGPNGSGKTTLFNIIINIYPPDSGKIYFKGKCINRLGLYRIAQMGISRTFQVIRLFNRLTVLQNLNVSCLYKKTENWRERALELLKYFDLTHLKNEYAENLSYGQQKLLEFAVALMPDPEFLMLDEPAAGINPKLQEKLIDHIIKFRDAGKTFLIIEHNIPFIMRIANRAIVLDHGQKIAEGTAEQIRNDKRVIEAYLGSSHK